MKAFKRGESPVRRSRRNSVEVPERWGCFFVCVLCSRLNAEGQTASRLVLRGEPGMVSIWRSDMQEAALPAASFVCAGWLLHRRAARVHTLICALSTRIIEIWTTWALIFNVGCVIWSTGPFPRTRI